MITLNGICDLVILLNGLWQIELLRSLNDEWIVLIDNHQALWFSAGSVPRTGEATDC
jgi:hypothetical protein